MDANTVTQVVTLALAVLAIIWHQQRTVDKLRDDFNASDREHRAAVREHGASLTEVKERLARIEGFLGIDMRERMFAHIQRLAAADLGDSDVMRDSQSEWPQQ